MKYDLKPANSRKSFYHKAIVDKLSDGSKILYSYGTPIAKIDEYGNIHRLWSGWTATTGVHIMSFCGLCKQKFLSLQLEK